MTTELAQAERLPRLIEKAAAALAKATTAAEVLDAHDQAKVAYDAAKLAARLAKAKDAYDAVITACHRAQADALIIEAQAKCRLADEYDAAQERGEVQKRGGDRKSINIPKGNNDPTVADIGLTSKQVHEARIVRDAEKRKPGIVRKTVDEKLQAGQEPTRADVKRALKPEPQYRGEAPRETKAEPETAPANRYDCSICDGTGIVTFGSRRLKDKNEIEVLRMFATFICANLRDEMLTITGDPKRMHRLGEIIESVNRFVPTTAQVPKSKAK